MHFEQRQYSPDQVAFVTLTYDEANLPRSPSGQPSLRRDDLRLFHYRLRKAMRQHGITYRYSQAGEYSPKPRMRPHYHLIVMFDRAVFGRYLPGQVSNKWDDHWKKYKRRARKRRLEPEWLYRTILDAWQYQGIVDIGQRRPGAEEYLADYVAKGLADKLPKGDDREPEFCRWSIGTGKRFAHELADMLKRKRFYFAEHPTHKGGDDWLGIPTQQLVTLDGRTFPLDAYMKAAMVERMGGDVRTEAEKFDQLHQLFSERHIMLSDCVTDAVDLLGDDTPAAIQSRQAAADKAIRRIKRKRNPTI